MKHKKWEEVGPSLEEAFLVEVDWFNKFVEKYDLHKEGLAKTQPELFQEIESLLDQKQQAFEETSGAIYRGFARWKKAIQQSRRKVSLESVMTAEDMEFARIGEELDARAETPASSP
jgi:hypothetical protein